VSAKATKALEVSLEIRIFAVAAHAWLGLERVLCTPGPAAQFLLHAATGLRVILLAGLSSPLWDHPHMCVTSAKLACTTLLSGFLPIACGVQRPCGTEGSLPQSRAPAEESWGRPGVWMASPILHKLPLMSLLPALRGQHAFFRLAVPRSHWRLHQMPWGMTAPARAKPSMAPLWMNTLGWCCLQQWGELLHIAALDVCGSPLSGRVSGCSIPG
jgi:hypothetical protein